MANKNSLKNLKPFKKGNPGGGRPKGSVSLTTVLKQILDKEIEIRDPITKEVGKKEIKEAVMLALIGRAMKGDIPAVKEVLERIDGKVAQKNELSGVDGGDIKIKSETTITSDLVKSRIDEIMAKQ